MLDLGLIGEEFKNCQKHLLKHLSGNIAWRHPEDTIAHRERLKQKRIAAREQAQTTVSHWNEESAVVPTENIDSTVNDSEVIFEEETESIGITM